MKVIYKAPGKEPELIQTVGRLEDLQELVGGYIESFTIAEDVTIICNEEGVLLGLPYNCTVLGNPFVGPILVVGVQGEEFCSVPEAAEKPVMMLLHKAEEKARKRRAER